MADWIEVGLLAVILLVQVARVVLDSGAWSELKQRRRLRRKGRTTHER